MKKKKKDLKKVIKKHVESDIKDFRKEIKKDEKLIKSIKSPQKADSKTKSAKKAKVEKVMHEYKEGKLHSGSKKGPEVTNPKQAIAIALSEARKVGKKKKK